MPTYHPESYWSYVAEEINKRGDSYLAGDDTPFHRYKRRKFLSRFLDTIDLDSKDVLEIGFGPGGNLKHIAQKFKPKKLLGVDISPKMVEIASRNLIPYGDLVELRKINGMDLPFADQSVDLSFTVTVLQHITDRAMFEQLVKEICRVTKGEIIIMEDISRTKEKQDKKTNSWINRTLDNYKLSFENCGFKMTTCQSLNIFISYFYYLVTVRLINVLQNGHKEGDPYGPLPQMIMALPMPITTFLDDIFPVNEDLVKLVFQRV